MPLAETIAMAGANGETYFPLWERIDLEIEAMKEGERIRAAIRERMAKPALYRVGTEASAMRHHIDTCNLRSEELRC